MPLHIRLGLAVALFCTGTVSTAAPKGDDALMQLLQTRNCPECQLADVDLVHAQLQDADLAGAKLQRANLSQARLDGANLRGADHGVNRAARSASSHRFPIEAAKKGEMLQRLK